MAVETGKAISANDCRAMALVYMALGDAGRTFRWLEKSYANHEESLCSINVDIKWNSIRSDPRFTVLLQKIGLWQYNG